MTNRTTNKDSVSQRVLEIFKSTPNRTYGRRAMLLMFAPNDRTKVIGALKYWNNHGKLITTGRGIYRLNVGDMPTKPETPIQKPTGKRKYVRRVQPLEGNNREVAIYLSHARRKMRDKDSPEYMLVSLAYFTLTGKME
jgi:hypothetical protein